MLQSEVAVTARQLPAHENVGHLGSGIENRLIPPHYFPRRVLASRRGQVHHCSSANSSRLSSGADP